LKIGPLARICQSSSALLLLKSINPIKEKVPKRPDIFLSTIPNTSLFPFCLPLLSGIVDGTKKCQIESLLHAKRHTLARYLSGVAWMSGWNRN